MTIKVKNITDVKSFFEKLNECKGTIALITDKGDTINLKSKLCQYIALVSVFNDPEIDNLELYCSEPADVIRIMDFLVRG